MFNGLIKKIFGTKHERQMKKLQPLVSAIAGLEPKMKARSDAELKALTADFKQQVHNGRSLDDLLPEAFAAVREASVRVLGMRHYDVQMIGGIGLHQGKITEMRTGEGKTLTATSALYLNALVGRGAHLITVNDYLASRDAEWMGQIYGFLGMSTGVIVNGMYHTERQKNYRADITYGTNNEFGFDYLRDNMKETIEKYVQRDLYYAIVDEVDSILIDEARTPLIISGESDKPPETYITVNKVIPSLRRDLDYTVDEKAHSVQLTDAGVDRIERLLGCRNLYAPENNELLHHVFQALRAHVLYKKDVNYIVEKGQVVIIDEFRGRKMEGRRWSDGLHQAVEAKEGVEIQPESQTLATITYQNYFRMYDKLAGMTGTADTEAEEFHKIYNLDVIVIPPNRTIQRKDEDDLVFKNERGKFRAVVNEIIEANKRGQPVLLGTASVEKSQVLHAMLERAGIPHEVLNAKNHEREAYIIAQAGRKFAVTVATNMAGRGTDILLGGNPEMMARARFDPDKEPEKYESLYKQIKAQCDEEKKEVLAAGGLYVIGTERHESRRIDNQLRGRSGRQGDPGRSRFFLSLEDDLMRIFGADRITGLMERLGMEEDVPIEAPLVNRAIANAQSRVEAMHFDTRKNLFEYDNVMNDQRKAIYALRKQILEGRYQPEILDEQARKEQAKSLPPPPEKSGPHTIASLSETVRTRITQILNNHCAALFEAQGQPIVPNALPPGGIVPEKLTHEIYRHYGALVLLEDVKHDREKLLARMIDVVARSLIQQRERVHDLAFKLVEQTVLELCPEDVHPDEWDLPGLEKAMLERFKVKTDLSQVEDSVDKLVDRVWRSVEALLTRPEKEFDLYTFLFYVRQFYLAEIDEQWIAHLKNIEHLRTGIGLVGYATRNPKNEYKIRGFNLFKEMWEGIENTVLGKVMSMQLTAAQKRQAEEGAEYETAVTRATRQAQDKVSSAQRQMAQVRAELSKLQEASRAVRERVAQPAAPAGGTGPAAAAAEAAAPPAAEKKLPKVGKNDPCPCGSGKLYRKCHGKEVAA
ncbi:preprotein translocase subunit SecA [Nannocystis exedens]|uniref:Protein translocase subunit SecA n=1 Tax=Nannocystis exedens TaxID=54 RepID=A0A1I1YQ90_9BACT|nr:preprotein translocase subunit SecA [Nannocystis exedens]PCC70295.1 preprotein translocase subunit SecA [Nannocystis exedens]SFE20333.1 preprotein translocase subunit SecA [Nannocystis exedens]